MGLIKNRVTLIQWNEVLEEAPTNDQVLILYKDDSGDSVNYYVTVAWKIAADIWIHNHECIYRNNIIFWAKFPTYEDVKVFE